ncbi:hypothetical protein BH09SUM1_BH09SUM1_19390 [soil metagenome]
MDIPILELKMALRAFVFAMEDDLEIRYVSIFLAIENRAERIELLNHIRLQIRKRMGARFSKLTGKFYAHRGLPRLYLEVMWALSMEHLEDGDYNNVFRAAREVLLRDSNDTDAIREKIVEAALIAGKLRIARKTLDDYEHLSCFFPLAQKYWGNVLEHYLSKRFDRAIMALAEARRECGRIEKYLIGKRYLPKKLKGNYAHSSEKEAQHLAVSPLAVWSLYPDAIAWLRDQ